MEVQLLFTDSSILFLNLYSDSIYEGLNWSIIFLSIYKIEKTIEINLNKEANYFDGQFKKPVIFYLQRKAFLF
jgi:hypothetical protein